ncbi:MAG: hypothetical protein WBA13_19440 [Microcoleaceae cyanobacterium]
MNSIKISSSPDNTRPPRIASLFYPQSSRESSLAQIYSSQPPHSSETKHWWSRLNSQRLARTGFCLLGLVGLVLWARWNGVLLLSTVCGMGTIIGVYRLPRFNWQQYWSQFRQLFSPPTRLLTIAVSSGGLVSISSYWMVSLLVSGENIWVALSLILQNIGILAIAGVLLWHFLREKTHQTQAYGNQLLTELTQEDALLRLIAVRKLTHLVLRSNTSVHPTQKTSSAILTPSQLAECFRLMLRSEAEPLVRNGLLDGLQQLEQTDSQ